MRRGKRCMASVFLSAALMMPLGALALMARQDSQEAQEQEEQEHRVYDPAYKDYHVWDSREEDAYRRWLDDQHEAYVFHGQLSEKTQKDYWKWRHKDLKKDHRTQRAENERPQ